MRWARIALGFLAAVAWARGAEAAKIACVGDSITYGSGLGNRGTESYPAVLQTLVGSAHTVQNFGVSGATLLKNGDKPYWDEPDYASSGSFAPDVVVIMLGTNDAKPQNWSHESEYAGDYAALIEHYRTLGATVYVMTPPPVYEPGAFDIPPAVVADEVVPLVHTIATDAGAPLVDVFTAMSDKSELFPDTVHPNAEGAALLAQTVHDALEANGYENAGMGGSGAGGMSGTGGSAGGAGQSGGMGGTSTSEGGEAGDVGSGGSGTAGTGGTGGASPSSGGMSTTGGTAPNGGAPASGASGSGGKPGSGGTGTTTGGSAGTTSTTTAGTSSAAAGASGAGSDAGDEGCGCRIGAAGSPRGAFGWGALALAGALARYRAGRRQVASKRKSAAAARS